MKTHYLKIESKWLYRLHSGRKTCEVRKNDRDYQTGDEIIFTEVPNEKGGVVITSADAKHLYKITHVLTCCDGLQEGYCILSIKPKK